MNKRHIAWQLLADEHSCSHRYDTQCFFFSCFFHFSPDIIELSMFADRDVNKRRVTSRIQWLRGRECCFKCLTIDECLFDTLAMKIKSDYRPVRCALLLSYHSGSFRWFQYFTIENHPLMVGNGSFGPRLIKIMMNNWSKERRNIFSKNHRELTFHSSCPKYWIVLLGTWDEREERGERKEVALSRGK